MSNNKGHSLDYTAILSHCQANIHSQKKKQPQVPPKEAFKNFAKQLIL